MSLGEGCNMEVATNHISLFIAGKEDPRCPVEGLESVLNKTTQVYDDMGVPSHFKVTMQFD
jgi:hypothetical protein